MVTKQSVPSLSSANRPFGALGPPPVPSLAFRFSRRHLSSSEQLLSKSTCAKPSLLMFTLTLARVYLPQRFYLRIKERKTSEITFMHDERAEEEDNIIFCLSGFISID